MLASVYSCACVSVRVCACLSCCTKHFSGLWISSGLAGLGLGSGLGVWGSELEFRGSGFSVWPWRVPCQLRALSAYRRPTRNVRTTRGLLPDLSLSLAS